MDDLALDSQLHFQALKGLERLNRACLSARVLWNPIREYALDTGRAPLRILDMAAGAGDVVIALTQKAQKENLPLVFEGCDLNPRAVAYANGRSRRQGLDLDFFQYDALRGPLPDRFDGVISSLFLHHLSDEHLGSFLKSMSNSQVKLLVLSDLKRSLRGLALCYAGTRLLSNSPIVHQDGLQSVRAALTTAEILRQAQSAGLAGVQIKSVWPMRYVLTWISP